MRKQNLDEVKKYEQYINNTQNVPINNQPIKSFFTYRDILRENTKFEYLEDVIIQRVINSNLKKNPKFRFYFGKPSYNFKIHFICDCEELVKFDDILSV